MCAEILSGVGNLGSFAFLPSERPVSPLHSWQNGGMNFDTLLGQVDSESIKKLPGRVRSPERIQQHINAFALHLQGVSYRGIQEHFGWKSLSTVQNSVRRGEELAKHLNLDNEKIKLKLAAYLDEILNITMRQLKEQVEVGRVTVDIDPDGKKSVRCTKGVDPRLLGEAGRGAIRFAQFCGLMDADTSTGNTGDVSTNVVFINPTADGAAWDQQVVDVTPSGHESGHNQALPAPEPSQPLERPTPKKGVVNQGDLF